MRSEIFGRLLKAGIGSIAICEGKTAPVVEDELGQRIGVTAASIQRYKSGHIPPELRSIDLLASACVSRGYLNREWLQSFLRAAHYPAAEKLIDKLCPIGLVREPPARVYQNLPAPTYSQFVMRAQPFAEVLDGLQQRSALVLIASLGGMGKTSLAREVAARCLSRDGDGPRFDAAVWVSDKDRPGATNLSVVLDEIARTLDYPGFTQFEHDEKRREVEQLLRRQKVLLVVDNFETISDSALLSWLLRLPEPSKAIVTSREYTRSFRNNTFVVDLRGMSEAEAQQFIGQRLRFLKIEKLVGDPTQLDPLVAATGGNPKAIELALGIVKHERRPIQHVVDDLYAARGELFDDLFTRAWALLDEAARRVLLSATFFPDSASSEALAATADVRGFAFDRAVERLMDLALLDAQQVDLASSPRYLLHPLVRAFAGARLGEQPSFEGGARDRWWSYFAEYVAKHLVRSSPQERYWNTLHSGSPLPIDIDMPNILNVLAWLVDNTKQGPLVEMMLLMVHYMDRHELFMQRIYYARRAADAAHQTGQYLDEALLRIDGVGWTLIDIDRLSEAEAEIRMGLQCIESLSREQLDVRDIIALAHAFLARLRICQQRFTESLHFIEIAESLLCQTVIRQRIVVIAGDLAYETGDYRKALGYYEEAALLTQTYSDDDIGVDQFYKRWGFTYLANGDLDQAEANFTRLFDSHYVFGPMEEVYGKYGLACVAYVRGCPEQAHYLAHEALQILSRLHVHHRLHEQICSFLAELPSPY